MRRPLIVTLSLVVLTFVLSGCGDNGGLKGDSFTVDTLEGSYQIQDTCTADFDGSRASLDGCTLEGLFQRPPITVETGFVRFGEERITVDGDTYYESDTACYGTARVNIAVSGELEKVEAGDGDGPFGALAGRWTGTLEAVESAPPYDVIDGAPADCEPFPGDEQTHATSVTAVVMSDTIDVTTDDGEFTITSDGDQVTVDGTSYQKQ